MSDPEQCLPPADPHALLRVDHGASGKDLRAAYRRFVVEHHPDQGGDPAWFIAGQEAYRRLSAASPTRDSADLQFHRRRSIARSLRRAAAAAALRITRQPATPPRVQ